MWGDKPKSNTLAVVRLNTHDISNLESRDFPQQGFKQSASLPRIVRRWRDFFKHLVGGD
jgi:hypothetical protein